MAHSLYVFEGVDGTGKTSLSKSFALKIGGIVCGGVPKALQPFKLFVDKQLPPLFRYWFYLLCNYIANREVRGKLMYADVVMDQYVYCTAAYHSVFLNKQLVLPRVFIQPRAIIYLIVPWDEIRKRLNNRGEQNRLERFDQLKRVDNSYRSLFSNLTNVLYFNNIGLSIEENVQLLTDKFVA